MDARWKTAPRAALALVALLLGGVEAVASPYDSVTDLGTGWGNAPEPDGQGRWVLTHGDGKTISFAGGDLSFPVDRGLLPTRDGFQGAGVRRPMTWEMTVAGSNARGTVIGGYPDGSSLAIPYSSLEHGFVTRQADGRYGNFVPLSSGNGQYLLLNALDQVVFDRWKLYDIGSKTTTNLVDLIPPEMIERLGPLASRPDAYWAFALADDGSILARVQDPSGERTLLLTPPTHAPEPSTLALLVAAGAGVAIRRYRRG